MSAFNEGLEKGSGCALGALGIVAVLIVALFFASHYVAPCPSCMGSGGCVLCGNTGKGILWGECSRCGGRKHCPECDGRGWKWNAGH